MIYFSFWPPPQKKKATTIYAVSNISSESDLQTQIVRT